MKWKFILSILCCTFFMSAIATDAPQDSISYQKRKRLQIRAIGDLNYPPYSYLNDKGEYVGYSIDVAKAIFEAIGKPYTIWLTNWEDALTKFHSDSLDVVIGMNYTEARAQKYAFNFSMAYLYYDFITLSNTSYFKQEQLKGKRIITTSSYLSDEYLRSIHFTDSIIVASSTLEGFRLLQEGKADALLSNRRSAQYYIKKNYHRSMFTLIPSDMPPFEHCLATHLYDLDFLTQLDKAFFIIKENGTLDAIYNKWFGDFDHVKHYKTLYYILIGVIAFLILSFVFVILLRHNVKKATKALRQSKITLTKTNKKLDEKITELEEKDHHLRKAKEKAEHSDRLKSQFLANMSHEIRTPLNAIVGFSELLTHEEDMALKSDYSQLITSNSNLLLSIINDILDLSKIESGIIDFEPTRFDFSKAFRQLAQTFQQQIKDSPITFIAKHTYRSCYIEGDQHRLAQVITNFMTNAIKFTSEGSVEMGYNYQKEGLYVYVKDTGIGIRPELQNKIFDRFYKINSFSQGTGLGMSICKAIIEGCGGKIGLISKHGKGSTFWFFYPCEADIH